MSRHGRYGGSSRCYGEWQEFMLCYASKDTTEPSQCQLKVNDYLECLHHTNELERAARIKGQLSEMKAEIGEVKNARKSTIKPVWDFWKDRNAEELSPTATKSLGLVE
ncbi:hypothetical protein CANCADRAFT_2790 [Tortispora caseinolytica NRRL Y-17796]|uniref:NADH dehydrogenase [ubiquinone] iron-sulfur protein 5 n=1 Tax=Tortispora caseinolytica NRRL Y-17796 TaxID=767744 RepID=A0A1E4TH38_9ASCO|nr:hypothetical protein CANCADRAFT_2790 [Tortispora caseinolytica NRRL Y-17796]